MDPDGANATRDGTAETEYVPVTYGNCGHITGPFFHGTKTVFSDGELLVSGHQSNYREGRTSNHIYFAAMLEPAIWGAELATALAGSNERGHIYLVEPTGPFEDDPNLTDKRFPGNVTQSYRTRHPLRVVEELHTWEGHNPAAIQGMLDGLARLREQGLDVIED
jgi:rifampin ADP-ribosylating transferase